MTKQRSFTYSEDFLAEIQQLALCKKGSDVTFALNKAFHSVQSRTDNKVRQPPTV